jgi:hypothetical protein
LEFTLDGDTYIVQQFFTPDLHALSSGIVDDENPSEALDFERRNFYYFAKHIRDIRETESKEEIECQAELRKATASGMLLWLMLLSFCSLVGLCTPWEPQPGAEEEREKLERLQREFPEIVKQFDLKEEEVVTFVNPESGKICPLCTACKHNISGLFLLVSCRCISPLDSVNDPLSPFWKVRRKFSHVWGFNQDAVGLCEFHALERLTEGLLCRTVKDDANGMSLT